VPHESNHPDTPPEPDARRCMFLLPDSGQPHGVPLTGRQRLYCSTCAPLAYAQRRVHLQRERSYTERSRMNRGRLNWLVSKFEQAALDGVVTKDEYVRRRLTDGSFRRELRTSLDGVFTFSPDPYVFAVAPKADVLLFC
jgi:hypothetical protein